MGFVSDAVVTASVQAALHADTLEDFWITIIADANAAAYRQILAHFIALGYTKAHVDLWDSGPDYQKFLARYQALIDGSGDTDKVGEWRKELDYWRGLLAAIQILETVSVVVPSDVPGSVVGHGKLSTATDIFRTSDGCGEITRW